MRLARVKRDISQRELAKVAGMSDTYVFQLERGDVDSLETNEKIKNPGVDAIAKIARVLNVPATWLAFGEGPEPDWDADHSAGAAQ
jgi:transcriptional regulator with XRE-family HTH domain